MLERLLQEVREGPDEDAPLLVLSDWLQDQPDQAVQARGELVRTQCLLAGMPPQAPERAGLEQREKELLARYSETWLQPLQRLRPASQVWKWKFERGLLRLETTIDLRPSGASGWSAEQFPPVPDWAWVAELRAWSEDSQNRAAAGETAIGLATSPLLRPLRWLALIGGYLDIDRAGARALASCPHLNGLTFLALHCNNLGDAGLEELASSPHLGRLRALALGYNRIGAAGVRALAASRMLPNLSDLNLRDNQVGVEGVRALASSWRRDRLQQVCIRLHTAEDNDEVEGALRGVGMPAGWDVKTAMC
jgi:uncharacterized protein (TIGR02996 family)